MITRRSRQTGQLWLLVWIGALLGGLTAAWAQPPAVTLVHVRGQTLVRRAGSAEYTPAAAKMTLAPGDIVRTGPNGVAVIMFADRSVRRLPPNSALSIPTAGAPIPPMPPLPPAMRPPGAPPFRPIPPGPVLRGERDRRIVVGRRHGVMVGKGKGFPSPEESVFVRRSGTGAFVRVHETLPVSSGDFVRVGRSTSATITFADGSQIKLKEDSRLLVPATGILRVHRKEPSRPDRERDKEKDARPAESKGAP